MPEGHAGSHGKGYATEARGAVIGRAFTEWGQEAVMSGAAAANGPSVRLLGRLEF